MARTVMVLRECGICGAIIRTAAPDTWHPRKLERRAERDLEEHRETHSFAEILRYEIRQDLSQVPTDTLPEIVRDIYRQLLGKVAEDGTFDLGPEDSQGIYSIDEVLGLSSLYRLWHDTLRTR